MILPDVRQAINAAAAHMGQAMTEEQMEFASDFTKPTICFSDPGTGKTNTLLLGMFLLQKYYGIPSEKICCFSYTNNASSEIAARYSGLCKSARISTRIHFSTFSSLMNDIVKKGYPGISITKGTIDSADDATYLSDKMEECGIDTSQKNNVHRISNMINRLNAGMVYSGEHLRNNMEFMKSGITPEQLDYMRLSMFEKAIYMRSMPQGDIPLYALASVIRKPEIAAEFKNKYKVMIVDEFQDMSLLNLQILRRITDTLIVVGDYKQLIYAFNGATERIADYYREFFPNARVCKLTKSFRCGQQIADFARDIIQPNFDGKERYEGFAGIDIPCEITIKPSVEYDWKELSTIIKAGLETKSYLILYRNNISAMPLVEQLYRNRVPMQIDYVPLMDQPMYNTLFDLIEGAIHSNDVIKVEKAMRHFPEFMKMDSMTNSILMNMRMNKQDFFEVCKYTKFSYSSSPKIAEAMMKSQALYKMGKSIAYVLGPVSRAYESEIYPKEFWKVKDSLEYLKSLVSTFIDTKLYDVFVQEEYDKVRFANECKAANRGVRLCTMHSAKGLEADVVYLLHMDDGLFPNLKVLKDCVGMGLYNEAYTSIHQERNLIFTAVTRAKTELHIMYDTVVTPLISSPNENDYTRIEAMVTEEPAYDDIGAFAKIYRLEV